MPKEFPKPKDYSPFTKLLGLSYPVHKDGTAQATMQLDERLLNNYETAHGGVIYSLADVAMGAAIWSTLDEDEICMTVEVKITYLKPAISGTLVCDARVVNKTKRIGTLKAEVTNDGQVIAKTTGKFHISRIKVD